jgi:hypothetical protein
MGWTSPRTWVAGEKPSAATMNAHIRDNFNAINGFVRKTADESVTSSATLQNDDHLLYTIGATGTYIAELCLFGTSAANAAGDLQFGFSFPTGTLHFGMQGLDTTLASSFDGTLRSTGVLSATSGTSNLTAGLSTSTIFIRVYAELIATATGTLQFMWAQQASNASASTLKSGSWMRVTQVA